MSNYKINLPLTKIIHNKGEDNKEIKKKSKSQIKSIKPPDIITQVKPSYLNNFVRPLNTHELSLTPSNYSNKLNNTTEYLLPPKTEEFNNKKTLILDLDETLVHSSFTPFQKNDIVLDVDFDGIMYNIYVLIRPYAEEFLKNVSKYFEIVIFTASISKYASPLLDILDKEKNIKYRLYRDHCTFINGIFVKDLKRLNRCLKDIIIVDNSPLAYAFDSDNGLPIKTWYDDPNDKELMKIEPLIIFLSKTKDVRKYIDRFVNDNEILYNEAMSIINCFEKNSMNNLDIDDNEILMKKENSGNIKVNINDNFENENNQLNDHKSNTLNMMKNIKFNIFSFNNLIKLKNFITTYNNSTEKLLNNENNEKNDILSTENISKDKTSIKNKIDTSNDSENNNIHNININNIRMKNQNIDILLRQPSSKKKNILRLTQKNNDPSFNLKINKNNGFNKNFQTNSFYNNSNTLMPLVLPFSNTVKNVSPQRKLFMNNTNNNNKINIVPIHMNGSIENNKKPKYINLLEKFEKNNKSKNKQTKKNFNLPKKNSNIKISSSITAYHDGIIPVTINKNINKEQKNNYLLFPKSNSISDVLKLNYMENKNSVNKHLQAKTPNRHIINKFGKDNNYNYKNNQKNEKKNLFVNLIKGMENSKTGRSKNTSSARPHNIRNYSKSCQRKHK